MVRALRHTLCPLPPLSDLLAATSAGLLNLADSRRIKRQPQMAGLASLLKAWLLG